MDATPSASTSRNRWSGWPGPAPDRRPRRPPADQFGFADSGKVAGILAASGWSAVDIQPLDLECVLPTLELERFMTRLGPLGQVLQDVDDPTRMRVMAAVRAAFEPFVHGDEVRYTAACWMVNARP